VKLEITDIAVKGNNSANRVAQKKTRVKTPTI
jgi:hypothetical protein